MSGYQLPESRGEGGIWPSSPAWVAFQKHWGGGCDVKKEVGLERPLVWARLTVLLDVVIPDAGETGGGGGMAPAFLPSEGGFLEASAWPLCET